MFQDGHEICFVGDEAFRELSQVDPKADELLNKVRYMPQSVAIFKVNRYTSVFSAIFTKAYNLAPRLLKLFSCSTQLSMKFFLLINVKMPTIVGILTFISRKIASQTYLILKNAEFLDILILASI